MHHPLQFNEMDQQLASKLFLMLRVPPHQMTIVPPTVENNLAIMSSSTPMLMSSNSPLYNPRECSSSSSIQMMDGYNATGTSSNTFISVKRPAKKNYNERDLLGPYQLPARLQTLIAGQEDLRNPAVKAKWIAEFMPKPEPPRFFRPLCARLARQQQLLREQQTVYIQKTSKDVEEARKRLNMSISEVRAEQKALLKELRLQRKEKEQRNRKSTNRDNNALTPRTKQQHLNPSSSANNTKNHHHRSATTKTKYSSLQSTPSTPVVGDRNDKHHRDSSQLVNRNNFAIDTTL